MGSLQFESRSSSCAIGARSLSPSTVELDVLTGSAVETAPLLLLVVVGALGMPLLLLTLSVTSSLEDFLSGKKERREKKLRMVLSILKSL